MIGRSENSEENACDVTRYPITRWKSVIYAPMFFKKYARVPFLYTFAPDFQREDRSGGDKYQRKAAAKVSTRQRVKQ